MQASISTEAGQGATSKSAAPRYEELSAAFPQLEILELIGQGGMGFVFKARQPKLERLVALKILPQSLAADPAFAERFTREGRVLARLNHPNIVTIHDFGQANGFFYLLMEFVDGVNLRQAMKVGRFTPTQALAVVPKICDALQFAHNEGILHRDIKPENILLDSKGRVKIADFGIAKMAGTGIGRAGSPLSGVGEHDESAHGMKRPTALTETGKVLGTPHYMAPEQLEHPQDVDHRADIYSLGVVFYEMLTGELPIGRFARPSEKSTVDPRVDEVVLHTLEKERERRTRTAGEVKTELEATSCTSAGGGLGEEQKQTAFAPTRRHWTTWTPFQSPREREVCSHLTDEERNKMGWLLLVFGLGMALHSLALITAVDNFKDRLGQSKEVLTIAFSAGCLIVAVGAGWLRLWRWKSQRVIRSCRWAKEHGLTSEQLSAGLLRGRNLWRPLGVLLALLALVYFQSKAISHYLEISYSKQLSKSKSTLRQGIPPQNIGKLVQSTAVTMRPAASPNAPPGYKLVIYFETYQIAHPEPGRLDWGFKCFVPPDHLASLLFVRWTNGAPTVDPDFSAYFKVGKAGGIDIPFCSLSFYPISESMVAGMTNSENRRLLARWGFPGPNGVTNAVQWNVNLGLGYTASAWMPMPSYHRVEAELPLEVRDGHQRAFRLVAFDGQEGDGNLDRSGIELRILLEPLRSLPIRTVPNEIDRTNHIAGRGLAGSMEGALKAIKEWPMDP